MMPWGWKRRDERLGGLAYLVVLAVSLLGLALVVNQTFRLSLFGFLPISTQYYYLLITLFMAAAFVLFPARAADAKRVPLYDWALVLLTFGCGLYLAVEAETMISQGWDILAPQGPAIVSGLVTLLALEAVRRAGGLPLFLICAVFGAYPLYADHMPGFLWGMSFSLAETASAHVMGAEGVLGIPMRVVADLLVGFIVFGVVLSCTGGGEFFMGFATALMGRTRGGPAKVAIISSGLFGSLSGSVISNVVTTGTITIPTMRRCGYPPAYAAAVEASASTGGALMPPVMGAVAFIMASFLNTSYSTIMVAAAVPAALFYGALVLQADAYAARNGLKGLAEKDIPALGAVLRKGWYYGIGLFALIYLLVFTSQESRAPYYVSLIILACVALFDRAQLTLPRLLDLLVEVGKNVAHLVAILAGVGLIVGALSTTGVGNAFSRELIQYAGTSVPLLLILGALTSFVLGMGMTVSACYVFLAIVLAPALTQLDLSPLAVHLFILYWGMLSYITPPVAIAAVAAAHIAGAKPLKTGFMAVRLALTVFVLPFIFVVNPALILQGSLPEILVAVTTTSIAVWLLAAGFERYLYGVGPLKQWQAVLVLAAAGTLMLPGHQTDLLGVLIMGALYGHHALTKRHAPHTLETGKTHD
jgi:TRAP transporter 4TM/12TM fusion protein